MSKTIYDAENNVLKIVKDEVNQNSELLNSNSETQVQAQKRSLRGFIVTVVNNEEELKEIQAGNHSKLQLSPVLASNEDEAAQITQEHGKIPLNVANYEFLKIQTTLIEELANKENVELIQLNLFNVSMDN